MSSGLPGSDFREGMIARRIGEVKSVLLVVSGKGGVGKSVVSAAMAAALAQAGHAVGLLDVDIYGPSVALLFRTRKRPRERRAGLVPPSVGGVKIMSVDLFAPGKPIPLTGTGSREVLREMLALTQWGPLDYLIVDMPPGTSDIAMLLTSLRHRNLAALVVTTPDRLSLAVAHRILELLHSGKIPTAGVVGNMQRLRRSAADGYESGPKRLAEGFRIPFLGALPFDQEVPHAPELGGVKRLLETRFGESVHKAVASHLERLAAGQE